MLTTEIIQILIYGSLITLIYYICIEYRVYKIFGYIDIQCEILPVPFDELTRMQPGEPSASIRERVVKARAIQSQRFADEPGIYCNAQMNSRMMQKYAPLSPECVKVIEFVMNKYDMSARAFDRIVKVSRTIADLDNSPEIQPQHVREAVSYRNLDRASWGRTTV